MCICLNGIQCTVYVYLYFSWSMYFICVCPVLCWAASVWLMRCCVGNLNVIFIVINNSIVIIFIRGPMIVLLCLFPCSSHWSLASCVITNTRLAARCQKMATDWIGILDWIGLVYFMWLPTRSADVQHLKYGRLDWIDKQPESKVNQICRSRQAIN